MTTLRTWLPDDHFIDREATPADFARHGVCPCCGLKWDDDTEQAACIELYCECIACRFSPSGKGSRSGSMEDLDCIHARARAEGRSTT